MVHMSRAYLTEKQMPQTFWYYDIKHSARMMNMIPGNYRGKLASPFMLVHGARPDPRTWLPLFLLCYFHHEKDSNASRSKLQAHTLVPSSSADLLPLTQYYSTTQEINVAMNRTATELIPIASHPWCIRPYNTMEDSLSPFIATTSQASVNRTHLGCEYST
jgi:hypothetical protein